MFPNDARLRNFTSIMTLDLNITYIICKAKIWKSKKTQHQTSKIQFGKMPITKIMYLYF